MNSCVSLRHSAGFAADCISLDGTSVTHLARGKASETGQLCQANSYKQTCFLASEAEVKAVLTENNLDEEDVIRRVGGNPADACSADLKVDQKQTRSKKSHNMKSKVDLHGIAVAVSRYDFFIRAVRLPASETYARVFALLYLVWSVLKFNYAFFDCACRVSTGTQRET